MKANHLPIDGYVLDDSESARRPHQCDQCGAWTTNIRVTIATGEQDNDLCDACLYEYYPQVNW